MIKPGELAIIKTSNEYCFVLEITDNSQLEGQQANIGKGLVDILSTVNSGFSGRTALVRIPRLTRDGVVHDRKTFFVEELTTEEERDAQQLERQKKMFAASGPGETPPEENIN